MVKPCSLRLQHFVERVVGSERYGSKPKHTEPEQAANVFSCLHEHEMEGCDILCAMLDVAQAFLFTIHEVVFSILTHVCFTREVFRSYPQGLCTYIQIHQCTRYISSPLVVYNKKRYMFSIFVRCCIHIIDQPFDS